MLPPPGGKPAPPVAFLLNTNMEDAMKQPHTEETVRHTDDQQDTGTHKKPDAPDAGGADRFGGSRAGKENVEPGRQERLPDTN
jgi:hypothetical protein